MSPVADCDLKFFLDRAPVPREDFETTRGHFGCLAAALAYLHNHECRHKDLKPQNILIKGGKILITDFGTARDWSELSRSTTKGQPAAFTRAYAAPEVVNEEERSSSADIWSLGCVYMDMVTVLKGETKQDRISFFESRGIGMTYPCTNFEALESWLALPRSSGDQQPLKWIRSMMQRLRKERVTASELLKNIQQYKDDHVYYRICCAEEEAMYDTSTIHKSGSIENLHDAQRCGSISRLGENVESDSVCKATKILLEAGFDIAGAKFNPNSALQWSARNGHDAVMQLLIDKGADPSIKDIRGKTALHYAAENDKTTIVRLLLDHGAEIEAKTNNGATALYWAGRNGHKKTVELLLCRNANVNAKDDLNNRTTLYWAAKNGHEKVAKSLLENEADVEAADDVNEGTALQAAAREGHEMITRLLLEEGADVKRQDKDMSALHWAARNGHVEVVQQLIRFGADTNATGRVGKTPLQLATEHGHQAVKRVLQAREEP